MIDFIEILRTPPQRRKPALQQYFIDVLQSYPQFSQKQRNELRIMTWMFEYSILTFKSTIQVQPKTSILVIDGMLSVSTNKRVSLKSNSYILHSKAMHISNNHELIIAVKDTQYLIIRPVDLDMCRVLSERGIRCQQQFLRGCKFTQNLNEQNFKCILCHGRHRVFHLGQSAYKKGDEVDGFYIVRKGTFMIKKSILFGNLFYKKVNTSELCAGEVISYSQLIQRQQYRNTDLVCNSAQGQLIFLPKQYFGIIKAPLQKVHKKRKILTQTVEKQRLKTLQNVMPYLRQPRKQHQFLQPSFTKHIKSNTRSFDCDQFQQQTFYKNSYSKASNKSSLSKSISYQKFKSNQKFMSADINQTSNNTICQKSTNKQINLKYQKFLRLKKQRSEQTMIIDTPFKAQAKAFQLTYQMQKLKLLCEGRCKKHCKKKYL